MSKSLKWYARRLQAMGPVEIALRVRSALRKRGEVGALAALHRAAAKNGVGESSVFPKLPDRQKFDSKVRAQIIENAQKTAAGHWVLLHGHQIQLDVPPNWQKDYLSGGIGDASMPSRSINYRALGADMDPRVVWELSRWTQLVRLAQAAYLGGLPEAPEQILSCLEDWVANNAVGYGLNWTSPMEPGLRLINFTWIHALLTESDLTALHHARLKAVTEKILPAHVWWTFRYHSFGSSANNHLLGELAGLILAQSRWPLVRQWSASQSKLANLLFGEVLRQFSVDGGNVETSLHYHLFAFELSWQSILALKASRIEIPANVMDRLARAGRFFADMVFPADPWDYGDSDDAHVTPFYTSEADSLQQWQHWLLGKPSPFSCWLQNPPLATGADAVGDWALYRETGYATADVEGWKLRLDASPLGFGSIAAHGQLDALHLSVWHGDRAVVIDPGTGSYFGKPEIREHFVSRQAHNGPHFSDDQLYPARHGAFLWGEHHAVPTLSAAQGAAKASLALGAEHVISRSARCSPREVEVTDEISSPAGTDVAIHWHFAPGTELVPISTGFSGVLDSFTFEFTTHASSDVHTELLLPESDSNGLLGLCSPYYRRVSRSPIIKISAKCPGQLHICSRILARELI